MRGIQNLFNSRKGTLCFLVVILSFVSLFLKLVSWEDVRWVLITVVPSYMFAQVLDDRSKQQGARSKERGEQQI